MPALPLRIVLMSATLAFGVAQAQPAPAPPAPAAPETKTAEPESRDDTPQPEATQLGKVEVRGKRTLFEDQALRRKKLLEGSAPCMGCDAKPREHIPGFFETIANYGLNQVTPQAPKETDAAGTAASQQVNERDFPSNRNP